MRLAPHQPSRRLATMPAARARTASSCRWIVTTFAVTSSIYWKFKISFLVRRTRLRSDRYLPRVDAHVRRLGALRILGPRL
jgi:hypothetical protein